VIAHLVAKDSVVGANLVLMFGAALAAAAPPSRQDVPCGCEVTAHPILAPPRPRGLTRVVGTVRPFFTVIGSGGGAIGDLAVDHYFELPLKLGVEVSPAAVAVQRGGGGAITHLRVEGAFATDHLEAGLAVGGRTENFGPGGLSLAGRVRLGSLDGLNLRLTYGYAIIRNRYTDQQQVAFSNVLGTLEVPLTERLAIVVDGAFSFDVWLYGTAGLKQVMVGRGGPGSWIVRAGFGVAWVLDRFPCQYRNPERCQGSAWGVGPTIAFGLERRL
jgi:hypothetical protein